MAQPYEQVILFGDSITEWSTNPHPGFAFQPALQWMFGRRFDVINRGFAGYNTQHALKVLPKFMPSPEQARVRLMYIFFGANDSAMPDNPTKQYVPLAQYKENLKTLIRHPQVEAHRPRIILITPPPIDEVALEECGFGEGGRLATNTAKYAEACREAASEANVPVCDLWTVFMKKACNGGEITNPLPGDKSGPRNEVLRDLLVDGLHFKPSAYELMFEAFKETIIKSFPDLDPTDLPPVYPPWTDAPK